MCSNIRCWVHQYSACFTTSTRYNIHSLQFHQKGKVYQAEIDSCSYAGKVGNILLSLEKYPIKSCHYWVNNAAVYIGCLPRVHGPFMSEKAIMPLLDRQLYRIILVAYQEFMDCLCQKTGNKKDRALSNGDWKYVPTKENLIDLDTTDIKAESLTKVWYEGPSLTKFWYEGPNWFAIKEDWPTQPIVVGAKNTQMETLKIEEKVMVAIASMDDKRNDFITNMTSIFTYRSLLRITGWILQFKQNWMVSKLDRPLLTLEIEYVKRLLIKIIQETTPGKNHLKKIMDNDRIYGGSTV